MLPNVSPSPNLYKVQRNIVFHRCMTCNYFFGHHSLKTAILFGITVVDGVYDRTHCTGIFVPRPSPFGDHRLPAMRLTGLRRPRREGDG